MRLRPLIAADWEQCGGTLHSAAQLIGVLVILLVLFGPPSQLSTVLALAAAGLTVALKDFIVAFFGWFVLMGRRIAGAVPDVFDGGK